MVDVVPSSTSSGSPIRRVSGSNDNIHSDYQLRLQQRQQLLLEKGLSSPSIDSRPPRNTNNPPTSNNSLLGDAKHNNWMSSSPFSQLGAISPGSAMSFSPGTFAFSPVANGREEDEGNVFSPSIFSPSPLKPTRVLKKRDYSSSLDIGSGPDGIAELQMNDGKQYNPSSARPTASDYLEISNLIIPGMYDPFLKPYGENFDVDGSERDDNQIDVRKKSSNHRKQGDSARRLNLDSMDDFLLGESSSSDSMNFLDDISSSTPLQVPGSRLYNNDLNIESFESNYKGKKEKSTAKSPARNNQYYSSPATILRPTAPTNMSPDMVNGVTKGGCNCKRSKCLKLYCECFKAQQYCSGCDCVDCNNLASHEGVRQEAIRATKERNATAFQPKVVVKDENATHNAGCNCKKSRCIKKYCECFEGSVLCSTSCKCVNCMNDGKSYSISKDNDKNKGFGSVTNTLVTPRKPLYDSDIAIDKNLISTPHSDVTKTRLDNQTNASENIKCPSNSKKRAEKNAIDNAKDGEATTPTSTSVVKKKTSATKSSTSESKASGNNNDNDLSSSNSKSKGSRNSSSGSKKIAPLKKRKVKFTHPKEPVYEFFGPNNPHTTKLTALRCLDFLEDKDIITMSQVNKLWSIAAMDDALWE